MQAIKGYYDGKNFIPLGNIKIEKNKVVIITVLDEYIDKNDDLQIKLNAVNDICGILEDEDKNIVDEFDQIISKRVNLSSVRRL